MLHVTKECVPPTWALAQVLHKYQRVLTNAALLVQCDGTNPFTSGQSLVRTTFVFVPRTVLDANAFLAVKHCTTWVAVGDLYNMQKTLAVLEQCYARHSPYQYAVYVLKWAGLRKKRSVVGVVMSEERYKEIFEWPPE